MIFAPAQHQCFSDSIVYMRVPTKFHLPGICSANAIESITLTVQHLVIHGKSPLFAAFINCEHLNNSSYPVHGWKAAIFIIQLRLFDRVAFIHSSIKTSEQMCLFAVGLKIHATIRWKLSTRPLFGVLPWAGHRQLSSPANQQHVD